MNKFLISAIAALLSDEVFAGQGTGMVEIESVGGYKAGQVVFFYTTNHSNPPACNTYRQRWVLDLSISGAKEQYALLLSAQAAGIPVVVSGTGDCSLYQDNDSEGVFWLGYKVTQP